MNTKMFYAFIKKKLGIPSPSTWLAHGYKYEYDWLKERRKKTQNDLLCNMSEHSRDS